MRHAQEQPDEPWDQLRHGFQSFLDVCTTGDFQRIVLIDGPAALGPGACGTHSSRSTGTACSPKRLRRAMSNGEIDELPVATARRTPRRPALRPGPLRERARTTPTRHGAKPDRSWTGCWRGCGAAEQGRGRIAGPGRRGRREGRGGHEGRHTCDRPGFRRTGHVPYRLYA
ncbi:hypothetical protein ACU686_26850 [Yinghuangia aomiensis]